MFQNRISAYDMNLDHQFGSSFGGVQPWTPMVARGPQAPQPSPTAVSMAAIFQAAAEKAIQDYELNKLFNPDYYDYQI